jgi:hypothetical protein
MKNATLKILFMQSLSISALIWPGTSTAQTGSSNATGKADSLTYVQRIDSLKKKGFPMVDYHAHLKGGLTMEGLLQHAKNTGLTYGVAANCGIGFPIDNDTAVLEYYNSLQSYPVYKGLQGEGREWITLVSIENVKKFDYVFTDGMTFTDDAGNRMRLWMANEVKMGDKQVFMDMLVNRITTIMNNEPINIYVNPTFLPEVISAEYDALWTNERMDKVIAAAVKNGIAIEINSRYKIPSATFIRRAKAAGAKFTLGVNNAGANDLGFDEYGMQMIKECKLVPSDFWQAKRKTIN